MQSKWLQLLLALLVAAVAASSPLAERHEEGEGAAAHTSMASAHVSLAAAHTSVASAHQAMATASSTDATAAATSAAPAHAQAASSVAEAHVASHNGKNSGAHHGMSSAPKKPIDIVVAAEDADDKLRSQPNLTEYQSGHAHGHANTAPLPVINETKIFQSKGPQALSYIEWDFDSGLGRLEELRRFTGPQADELLKAEPTRPVMGVSGGRWRTLADIDSPRTWKPLLDDIRSRIGQDGRSEPARYKGLAALHALSMIISCFILLPLLLTLQAAGSRWVSITAVLYLASLVGCLMLGRLYSALTPALYPPNAYVGLAAAMFWLSVACFAWDALKVVLIFRDVFRTTPGERFSRFGQAWDQLRSRGEYAHPPAFGQEDDEAQFGKPTGHHGSGSVLFMQPQSGQSPHSQSTSSTERTLTGTGHHGDHTQSDGGYAHYTDAQRSSSPDDMPDASAGMEPEQAWSSGVPRQKRFPRLRMFLSCAYSTVSRSLVLIAFAWMYVGIAVYTGSCRAGFRNVCLAHGIKGAIFFWYGVLSFVRFLGAFGEYGWAWNKRPTPENSQHSPAAFWRRNMPSGEFIECFVIFLYGISNTWLERLGAQRGDPYTVKQIQHISIAVMFWFVGLVGMGLESTRVRQLLSRPIVGAHPAAAVPNPGQDAVLAQVQPPSYISSFNPFPALVIGATGVAMAAHHQDYEYEVKVHVLWGIMLAAFAVLRCFTYFFLWLRPPTSVIPSRPPTEALASFTLCCGGLLFMLSNEEVSFAAMRADYADPMAVLNFAISVVGLVLCWSFCIMLIKAWALKRETRNFANTSEPWAQEQHFVISEPYEAA